MTTTTSLTAAAAPVVDRRVQSTSLASTSATTTYHRMTVDGVGVFYREAGPRHAPTIVLLHGFPSSSREFDTLIPLLATRYHLIVPDFPGFGQSDAPPTSSYAYTFDNLARTISRLLEQLKINEYTFYLHDYGGPIGFRMISAHPERLRALIIQNANVYEEGLGAKWSSIAQYWADPKAHPEVFDAFVSLKATEQRHTLGTSHPERYNPDTWTDEYAHLSRPGQREIQADLLYDYRTNVASYSAWQAWLREHKPPILVVWGRNDPSFIAAALRHQLIVLRRRVRGRVQLTNGDRLFLVMVYRWFPSVLKAITIIRPIRRTGDYGILPWPLRSFGFDVRRPDYLGPLLGIVDQEFPEFGWRQWHRDVPEAGDSCPNFVI